MQDKNLDINRINVDVLINRNQPSKFKDKMTVLHLHLDIEFLRIQVVFDWY